MDEGPRRKLQPAALGLLGEIIQPLAPPAALRHLAWLEGGTTSNGGLRAHGGPLAWTVSTQIENYLCRLDARSSEDSLLQPTRGHLVAGQIGDGAAQAIGLRLELLYQFCLIRL
jgi:hypothetical protein